MTARIRLAFAAIFVACGLLLLTTSCGGGGGGGRFAFTLTLTGLPDSGTVRGHYEGWAVVNGLAFSTGKFVVVGTGPTAIVQNPAGTRILGTAAAAEFGPSITLIGDDFPRITEASHLFITLEPEGDHDRAPSCQVLLAGEIIGETATLTTQGVAVPITVACSVPDGMGGARLGLGDLSGSTGMFQLASPTDDLSNPGPNDFAGVWFANLPLSAPGTAGSEGEDGVVTSTLDLPILPGGFRYEGFAVVDGITRSLGRFILPNGKDSDFATALQRGDDAPGPPFPGGDFVQPFTPAAPCDPPIIDLTENDAFFNGNYRAFITVEPSPDNDTAPFPLRVLSRVVPADGVNSGGAGNTNLTMDSLAAQLPTAEVALAVDSVTLTDLGLEPLSGSATDRRGHYELWVAGTGAAESAGRFLVVGQDVFSLDVMANIGTISSVTFDAASTGNPAFPDASAAVEVFITFECEGDDDDTPSIRTLLDGAVSMQQASLTLAGSLPAGGRGLADFSTVAGTFQLDTSSNDAPGVLADDQFGIFYRDVNEGSDLTAASLELPLLPFGFRYEGWVQDRETGELFSTGKFLLAGAADDQDMVSQSRGDELKPGFPGEDFLNGVPTTAFAAAMSGSITEVFITVEPFPDNSFEPSFIRVLEATVPPGAVAAGISTGPVPMTNVFDSLVNISGFMTFEGD